MHLIGSTIMAWLNLGGWLVVTVVLLAHQEAILRDDFRACSTVIGLTAWLIGCATVAVLFSVRCWRLRCCCNDPEYVGILSRDLNSSKVEVRLRALRTLADFCAEPLAAGSPVFPFGLLETWQVKAVYSLLTRRAQAQVVAAAQPAATSREAGPILEPLCRGAAETLERLGDAVKDTMLDWTPDSADHAEPAEEPLPPLSAEQFVEALRGPAEVILAALATVVNDASDARTVLAGRERCQELFRTFVDGALELGLSMRIDAAVAALPLSHTAANSCATDEWHAAEASPRGPSHSWVDKYRRMKADKSDLF